MRILMSLLLLVLFCSIQLTSSAPHALETESSCCFQFYNKIIPLKRVVSFYRTGSNCPRPAIVFRTAAGREFCLDPYNSWVNSHIAEVNSRTTAATSKTLSTTV
ncbi:C-C motif chemokine 4-like [Carassius auratus]|uniref:C-C motif chemokine 4-like n=1 Tax=Carassius auratus TaxID=7957 RepID=A0A6P6JBS1_CARAU|nr:C-C motif chemokine 4-like [Carassius auratus]